MKAGIMQPYFMPYLGYWQLMNAVDVYVIYDDVNFIKGGWINRNRILNGEKVQYINVQMKGASSFKRINQIEVQRDKIYIEKTKRTVWNAYHNAPHFTETYFLLEDIFDCDKDNLASYLEYSIRKVCAHLGIDTKLLISSEIVKNNSLKGEEKVIEICKNLGADMYYNAIGGRELYDFEHFRERGMELFFLQPGDTVYVQGGKPFVPNLSIIDVMMYNSVEEIVAMLRNYTLIAE